MVAFLDESILNSQNPLFADWPRKPLQEELFGTHIAGEVFFQNLQKLLGRQRFAGSGRPAGSLLPLPAAGLSAAGTARANRGESEPGHEHDAPTRSAASAGRFGRLSPAWMLPDETAARQHRTPGSASWPGSRRSAPALMVVLFVVYKIVLVAARGGRVGR